MARMVLRGSSRIEAVVAGRARPLVALAGIAAAALLLGCGASGPSDTTAVKNTVKAFLAEAAAGNGRAACRRVTPAGQQFVRALTSQPCPVIVGALRNQLTPAQRSRLAKVEAAVKLRGSTASATYPAVTGTSSRTLELQKVSGSWRISKLPTSTN